MKKDNVLEFSGREAISDPLTDLLRSGAQQLINQAVEAELQELLSQHSGRRTENGHVGVGRWLNSLIGTPFAGCPSTVRRKTPKKVRPRALPSWIMWRGSRG